MFGNAEFGAAIVGALVGGALAIISQYLLEERRDRKMRANAAKALLFSLLQLHNEIRNISHWTRQGYHHSRVTGMTLVDATGTLDTTPSNFALNHHDKIVAGELSDGELLNNVVKIDHQGNHIISLVIKYHLLRDQFYTSMDFEMASGIHGFYDPSLWSAKQHLDFELLNETLESIRVLSLEAAHLSRHTVELLILQMKSQLGSRIRVRLLD